MPPTKEELIAMLDEMIKTIDDLPQIAKITPVNHYDHCALMMLLSAILKCKD